MNVWDSYSKEIKREIKKSLHQNFVAKGREKMFLLQYKGQRRSQDFKKKGGGGWGAQIHAQLLRIIDRNQTPIQMV